MSIVYDSELSFVFLSNSLIEYPNLRRDFESYYETDKYRFYDRARHSTYYNQYNMRDNMLEFEVAMKRIYGILLCAEDDEAVREFVCKKLMNADNIYKELVKNPNDKGMSKFESHMTKHKPKSYNALNAPWRILAYLLYTTYGTESDNTVVNSYLLRMHSLNVEMSSYNKESYIKYHQGPRSGNIVITRRVRNIISKLRTGLGICSFIDFGEKELQRIESPVIDSELYNYIKDYYRIGDDKESDIMRAVMIANMATSIMNVTGSSLSGQFGHSSITKDEEELIINILGASTLVESGEGNNQEWCPDIAVYLIGVIFMLMAKEINSMKEFYFRNNSETQYLELQRLDKIIDDKDLEIERLKVELASANERNERHKEEIKRLTDEVFKENKEAIRPYVSELSELNSRIKGFEKALEIEREKTVELNALREFAFAVQSEYIPPETSVTLSELIKGKKIIIVGGHINWRNKMKERYPSIVFLDGHNVSFENAIFVNADITLLYTSNMSHKLYYKIIDYIRDKRLRFDYLGRSINPNLLEAEIISILQEKM